MKCDLFVYNNHFEFECLFIKIISNSKKYAKNFLIDFLLIAIIFDLKIIFQYFEDFFINDIIFYFYIQLILS